MCTLSTLAEDLDFIIRIGFWGPLYCNYNEEPQNSIRNYLGSYNVRTLFQFQTCYRKYSVLAASAAACKASLDVAMNYHMGVSENRRL